MSLSTLPDLCLLTILDRIPLYDLLATVNRVCHRWASLSPAGCHRRRSLILNERKNEHDWLIRKLSLQFHYWFTVDVINDDGTLYNGSKHHLENHTLTIKNQESILNLIPLFPNLTSFQFGQRISSWTESIGLIVRLLKECSAKLVHLNLLLLGNNFQTKNKLNLELFDLLFDQINKLSSLKRLRIQTDFNNRKSKLKTKLTVLRQVEQLECYTTFDHCIIDNIEEVLKSANCALKRICISASEKLEHSSPKLQSLITDYDIMEPENLNELSFKMSHLNSLECLKIHSFSLKMPFAQFINSISHHLSKLIILEIHMSLKDFFQRTDIVPNEMPSVKMFNLHIEGLRTHRQLKNLPLAIAFPNVQIIKFWYYKLTCSACDKRALADSRYSIIDCPLRILKPLKQCSKLRKIYFGKENVTPDQL